MASFAEHAAVRRQAKLDDIQQQIKTGSLVVRAMTAAELKLNPPRPERPLRKPRIPRR